MIPLTTYRLHYVSDSSGETQVYKREKKSRGGITQASNTFKKVKRNEKSDSSDDEAKPGGSSVNVAFKGEHLLESCKLKVALKIR